MSGPAVVVDYDTNWPNRADVRPSESPFAEFVVVFRDWLRAHPDEAAAYARMKRRTAEQHADDADYDDYTRAKSAYFDEIEPLMWEWAATQRG